MRTRPEEYTVGWMCAIEIERVVACSMLDEVYARDREPYIDTLRDHNSYTFGRIYDHNIVITSLPQGRYGVTSAAIVAAHMQSSFPALRTRLMVGIAGGAPSGKHDIRLGDIVVSSPTPTYGGVIQYDFGKALQKQEFEITSHMAPPPDYLLTAMSHLKAKHKAYGHQVSQIVTSMLERNPRLQSECGRPGPELDQLYQSEYNHAGQAKCNCQTIDPNVQYPMVIKRRTRGQDEDDPMIHYGLIASANQLMKDAPIRDSLIKKYDVLCFEMEAAGLMNSFPCLVIRGICDYSDSHKMDAWQGYAAAVAGAYAKELLQVIPASLGTPIVAEFDQQSKNNKYDIPFTLAGVPVTKKFIDRPSEIQSLQDTLLSSTCRRKIFVLRGLGGMGKTQLAVEFMRSYHARFTAVLWLDGSSVDSLRQSIAQLAGRIFPDQLLTPNGANTGNNNTDVMVDKVLEWLSQSDNDRWLVIFDNVDREFADLDPLSYDIQKYIPHSDHGSILITTRLMQLEKLGDSYEVEKVDQATAQEILTSWYKKKCDDADVKDLLKKLDGLPLAIAQAGAYLQENGMSIRTYLRLYDEENKDVVEALQKSDTLLNDYPNRSVWTTWNISYNAVLAKSKYVANLLILWSFMDRNDLWYGIFQRSRASSITPPPSNWLGNIVDGEQSFIQAMGILRSYSLIESAVHTRGYSMHAVVHRWVYLFHGTQQKDLGVLALKIIGFTIPVPTEREYVQLQRRLMPHVNICSARILEQSEGSACNDAHGEGLGFQLDLQGLHAIHMYAMLYGCQHKAKVAEKLYVRAIPGMQALLGLNHSLTLAAMKNLGVIYHYQRRFDKAENILSRGLEVMNQTLGITHEFTLLTIRSLGTVYREQGKFAGAENLLLQAMQGMLNTVGPHHPLTLDTINSLGDLYHKQNKLAEAERILLQALQGWKQHFGPELVKTSMEALRTMWILGDIYLKIKPDKARVMYSRVLAGYTTVFGPSHQYCARIRRRLDALTTMQELSGDSDLDQLPGTQENPTERQAHKRKRSLGS